MEMLSDGVRGIELGGVSKAVGTAGEGRQCVIGVEHAKGETAVGVPGGNQYLEKVTVSGWVVCRQLIEKIVFEAGGSVLGIATYGIYRPDVGSAYPAYLGSERAGFTAALSNVQWINDSVPDVNISVWAKGGKRYTGKLRLQVAGLQSQTMTTTAAAQRVAPRLSVEAFVDTAEVDADGMLWVRGWAIAPVEIIAVQIVGNDTQLGLATMGLGRSDVAASYPLYPNVKASGFEFHTRLNPYLLGHLQAIQIEVIARNGEARTISTSVVRIGVGSRSVAGVAASVTPTKVDEHAQSAIRHNCDDAEISRSGAGYLGGWATSPDGIKSVALLIGGVVVGGGKLGLAREDVGASLPDIPNSAFSGFEIHFELGKPVAGDTSAVLRVEDGLGDTMEVPVSLQIRDALSHHPASAVIAPQDSADDFKMHLDSPTIRGAQAIEPITGAITVAGWAVARHGLKTVQLFLGSMLLGQARVGSRRPDIAAMYSDWPDSLISGFGLFVPAGMIKNGAQQLSVVLTDNRGVRRTSHIQVDVQKTAAGEGDRPLRRKLPVVESDINLRILSGAGVAPQFDILMTVDDWAGTRGLLPTTLRALNAQTYPRWRLFLLAPDLKNSKAVAGLRALIPSEMAAKVEVLFRLPELLSAVTSAPDASSETTPGCHYVVNLHAGDELAVDALLNVAMSNVGVAAAEFIYGDERRESPVSHRVQPFLKPEWSPELLLSTNYIGRLWVASARLVDECFPSVANFVASSDYDRVLKLTERSRSIRRVAKVLSERHANQFETKKSDYQALQQAATRRGIAVTVSDGAVEGSYRFHRKIVIPGKVSIIIPSIAARGLVKTCIESIKAKSTFKNYEIVLLDNIRDASSKWKPWFVENADKVVEVLDDFNWSYFNNLGAYHASGEYLLFLNDDMEVVDPQWLEALMENAQREEVGVVGARLLYPDSTVQHAGLFLSGPGTARHAFRFSAESEPGYFGFALTQRNVIGVTGACMMMRREVFDALGGFNQAHIVINNDVDFCLRCNDVGLSVIYTPYATLIHHELVSRVRIADTYDKEAFAIEWADVFSKCDPFFHPELSRNDDNYTIDTETLREVYSGYPIARRSQIQRIVVFKLDHIGDFITALPAIRRLKKHFPQALLTAVVAPAVASLARMEPTISEVLEFGFFHARSGLGLKPIGEEDLLALKARLEPYQFDLAVDLRKHPDTRHVLQYSGARLFAGLDHANKFPWLDFGLEWEGDPTWVNKRQHVAGDLLNLVDAIANGCEEERLVLWRPDDGGKRALPPAIAKISKELYRLPVIGIHPASGNELRQWPAESFAELIDMLVTRLPVNVAVVGGPDELELANAVLEKVKQRQRVWSLVGAHKLSELPDVLSSFALFVGNNSGPKHVAAGLGVPTVAVHSAVVSTEEWGPLGPSAVAIRKDVNCGPCYHAALESCHRNIACMRDIAPEDVYKLCLRFLALVVYAGDPQN